MLKRDKLLRAINNDLRQVTKALELSVENDDRPGIKQGLVEWGTLHQHLQMTIEASSQEELEKVIQSLEKNVVIVYQNWRQLATE
jgi:hypothetical protein